MRGRDTPPAPLKRGGLECCFFFDNLGFMWLFLILGAMLGRHTPPTPLKRGGLECCFLVVNEWFIVLKFPSGEGIEGCVMVRDAA